MKGLVILGVCAMNMFGLGTSTAGTADPSKTGEAIGQDIATTDCVSHVSNERSDESTVAVSSGDGTTATKK